MYFKIAVDGMYIFQDRKKIRRAIVDVEVAE